MPFKQIFTADDRELLAAYKRLEAANEKLKQKIAEVGEESKKADEKQTLGAVELAKGLTVAGLAYGALTAAVRTYNAEVERRIALEKKATDAQMSIAGGQQLFLTNLGFVDKQTRAAAVASVEAASKRTGVDLNTMYQAASDAVSARGNVSIGGAVGAVGAAGSVAGNNPEMIRALAGGILDTAGMTGLTGDKDMRKNLGFLMGVGSVARVTNLRDIALNLVPGMKGVRGFGDSASNAGALLATMSSELVDPTGAISGTSSIALAKQLAGALPDLKSTDERIKFLQQNAKAREAFMKKASFEQKAFVPIRELLTGGSATAKLYEANKAAILSPEAAEKELDKWQIETGQFDAQQIAAFSRQADVGLEAISRADPRLALRNLAREKVADAMSRLPGGNAISDRVSAAMMKHGNATPQQILQSEINRMEFEPGISTGGPGAIPGPARRRDLNGIESAQVAVLREILDTLNKTEENTKKSADDAAKQKRQPAPAVNANTE